MPQENLYPEPHNTLCNAVCNATTGDTVLLISQCSDIISHLEEHGFEIVKKKSFIHIPSLRTMEDVDDSLKSTNRKKI